MSNSYSFLFCRFCRYCAYLSFLSKRLNKNFIRVKNAAIKRKRAKGKMTRHNAVKRKQGGVLARYGGFKAASRTAC
jgi:hypothetical protein